MSMQNTPPISGHLNGKKHINGTFSDFSFPCLMTTGYQFDFEKNQGKEGPNVHLAACIARVVDPKFFAKRVESSSSVFTFSAWQGRTSKVGYGSG